MIILNADLDNTIIYSYKHDIGSRKRSVELYQGREISFITDRTYELLNSIRGRMEIVPTSTRTVEQYERINLGGAPFKYALVCNGGILLTNGVRDEGWYKRSLVNIEGSVPELERAIRMLENDKRRKFELRFIERLFIFTKCSEPQKVIDDLKAALDLNLVDVFGNGEKVYVVPKELSKGKAVRRFREYIKADYVIAAGDSEFDISMLVVADKGLAPFGFSQKYGIDLNKFSIKEMEEGMLFSEALLTHCLVGN